MRRFTGWLLVMALIFSLASAAAQTVDCPAGGFSLTLPDHFSEETFDPHADPELCLYWHGKKLSVQAYASYQGEIAGSDLFQVLTGYETEYGPVVINGMDMLYTRTEEFGEVCITYSWMDLGNNVTLEFRYSQDEPSVLKTVNEIIGSITFYDGR